MSTSYNYRIIARIIAASKDEVNADAAANFQDTLEPFSVPVFDRTTGALKYYWTGFATQAESLPKLRGLALKYSASMHVWIWPENEGTWDELNPYVADLANVTAEVTTPQGALDAMGGKVGGDE